MIKRGHLLSVSEASSDTWRVAPTTSQVTARELPQDLYRKHTREYSRISLKEKSGISFKEFENTLLSTLNIHRKFPVTFIIEKFLCELTNDYFDLKVVFKYGDENLILRMISLLLFITKESSKTLLHVLSIIKLLYKKYSYSKNITNKIEKVIKSVESESIFNFTWWVFFSRYLGLETKYSFKDDGDQFYKNGFVKSVHNNRQEFF